MQLVVEPTGVTNGLAVVVPAPEGRRRRPAVGAAEADATGRRLEHGTLEGRERERRKCHSSNNKDKSKVICTVRVARWSKI